MDDATRLASLQLQRMRGMTVEYHRRFFGDIRTAIVLINALFVIGFWEIPEAFLLIPAVALYTAVQTAFDASYLIFARQYAARLERYLNGAVDRKIHVGAEMEDSYLFPLDQRKIVTAALGRGFSWFGFVTLFHTALGVVASLFALALAWSEVLVELRAAWQLAYFGALGALTAAALGVGIWWFVGGTGEARLRAVLDGFAADAR